jgi:hypothetical protein
VIRGLGGDDILCGGPGKDRLIDKGKDGHDGGRGQDTCDRNRGEKAKGCETTTGREVHRAVCGARGDHALGSA